MYPHLLLLFFFFLTSANKKYMYCLFLVSGGKSTFVVTVIKQTRLHRLVLHICHIFLEFLNFYCFF